MVFYDFGMIGWMVRAWPWWAEALLVACVGASCVPEAYFAADGRPMGPGVGVAAGAALALPLRHRWPWPTAALVVAAAVAGSGLPLLVVLFFLASRGRAVPGLVCAAVALLGNGLVRPQQSLWTVRAYGPLLPFAVVLALGLWAASHRRLVEALAGQVAHLRREREFRAEQARLAERARIAAEMHDVLAHRLTVLALHTGALQRRADGLPGHVADRIGLLRTTSTEALADLRAVLGVLRDHEPPRPGGSGVPGRRELEELIDEARVAGQHVDAAVDGEPTAVPAGHRLAAHRLVQESLTNARKHAPGAAVRVEVRYASPELTVTVHNTAAPAPPRREAGGYGLVGLAERVAALGGSLEHGPDASGGWRVAARIPLDGRYPAVAA